MRHLEFGEALTTRAARVAGLLWRVCSRVLFGAYRHLVEDAVLEALTKISHRAAKMRAGEIKNERAWIAKIGRSTAIDFLRRHRRHLEDRDPLTEIMHVLAAEAPSPQRRLELQGLFKQLFESLERRLDWQVLLLALRGVRQCEIAEILEVSPSTIHRAIGRVRLTYLALLDPDDYPPGGVRLTRSAEAQDEEAAGDDDVLHDRDGPGLEALVRLVLELPALRGAGAVADDCVADLEDVLHKLGVTTVPRRAAARWMPVGTVFYATRPTIHRLAIHICDPGGKLDVQGHRLESECRRLLVQIFDDVLCRTGRPSRTSSPQRWRLSWKAKSRGQEPGESMRINLVGHRHAGGHPAYDRHFYSDLTRRMEDNLRINFDEEASRDRRRRHGFFSVPIQRTGAHRKGID